MTKQCRAFSPEFKRIAVALVLDQNYNHMDTCRPVGVAESVLLRWVEQLQLERWKAIVKSGVCGAVARSGGQRLRSRCAFNHRGSVFEGNAFQKLINFRGPHMLLMLSRDVTECEQCVSIFREFLDCLRVPGRVRVDELIERNNCIGARRSIPDLRECRLGLPMLRFWHRIADVSDFAKPAALMPGLRKHLFQRPP
ncbi:transposase [Pandoraea horticolens]|uniref:Transposase n=1 Tax=Pandoraea horticolens TaxID=2508298 RepID=A0A5E4YSE2_9BURK|nr:transposase [Pandoraea horticolens]